MRTTIELTDESHEAVSALARRQGLRGLSQVIQAAVDAYLGSLAADAIEAILALEGTVSDEAAEAMQESMRMTRSTWR